MACKHFDCICYDVGTESCDYFLIFGKRRPVPGDECHLCLHDFDDEHKPLIRGRKARHINFDLLKRFEDAYSPDKLIMDIAKEVHVSADYAAKWVNKVHPEHPSLGRVSRNEL